MKKWLVYLLSLLIPLSIIGPMPALADGGDAGSKADLTGAIAKTVAWYQKQYPSPDYWEGLPALWGAGEDLNGEPWQATQGWRETDPGFAADTKTNEHLYYIFKLLAVGENPANAWGERNLFAELAAQQTEAGAFGGNLGKHLWALVALDVGKELGVNVGDWDEENRQKAIDYLLDQQNNDGSFGPFSQLDYTGWSLTALSNYKGNSNVNDAISEAIDYLKGKQQGNAGFEMEGTGGEENSNSNAAVLSGLVAVGEDVLNPDSAWVKNGTTILDALLKCQQEDGSFWYKENSAGGIKASTVQCLMALVDLKYGESTRHRMGKEIEFAPCSEPEPVTVYLTVEGKTEIILSTTGITVQPTAGVPTVLDTLEQGLDVAKIPYELQYYDWGVLVSSIAGEENAFFGGWDGWSYTVNEVSPDVGAADYMVAEDDVVLFYYSRWPAISTKSVIEPGDENPEVEVVLVGDEYAVEACVEKIENWVVDTGETGLTVAKITRNDVQKATITFTGTAADGTISIQAKAAVLWGDADSDELILTIKTNAIIDPETVTFDKKVGAQADVTTTITWGSAVSVFAVEQGGEDLTADVHYTVVDNILTIKRSYLATLPVGETVLNIVFGKGDPATLTIVVSDTTPAGPNGDLLDAAGGTDFAGVLYARDGDIFYNWADAGGAWGSEVLIGAGAEGRLAVDSTDKTHVVYTTPGGVIGYRMYDGNAWSAEEKIESLNIGAAGSCSQPDIAVDGNCVPHLTYTDSHGSSDNCISKPDIMYANRSNEGFIRELLFRGYQNEEFDAELFNKGSYIAVNDNGDYFILSHKQSLKASSQVGGGSYNIVVKSNLGSGETAASKADIYDIYDLVAKGVKAVALYKDSDSIIKTAELTVSDGTVNFTNTNELASTSISSVASDGVNVVAGGFSPGKLQTYCNGVTVTYDGLVVKGTQVSVVSQNGGFSAVYADGDGNIRVQPVETPQPDEPGGKEDNIAVTFKLIGDNKNIWVPATAISVPQDSTVFYAFDKVLSENNMQYVGGTDYISGIQAPSPFGGGLLSQSDNGPMSGWMYLVNGQEPSVGPDAYELEDGDSILFYYTDDFMQPVCMDLPYIAEGEITDITITEDGSLGWGAEPQVTFTDGKFDVPLTVTEFTFKDGHRKFKAGFSFAEDNWNFEKAESADFPAQAGYAWISVTDPNATGSQTRVYYTLAKLKMNDDETAFSLLQRTGLNIRTAAYSQYAGIYVEAIDGFGEFDDGPLSGWMCKVNGQLLDYSASQYTLEDGDRVEWLYTRDLGKDLGSGWGSEKAPGADADRTVEPKATVKGAKASVSLDLADIKDAISSAKEKDDAIIIAPKTSGTLKSMEVSLSKEALLEIVKQSESPLVIQTSIGSVTIPHSALFSIASRATGSTITITNETIEKEVITKAQQKIVGDSNIFDISIMSGGRQITSFDGQSITISLPYELKAGEKAANVKIWHLNDAGVLEQITCAYDEKTGLATFKTAHLSYYLVGVGKVEEEEKEKGKEDFTLNFSDVKSGDWYYEAVKYAVQNGLFVGTTEAAFSPNKPMTRAMLVTVLHRLEGLPAATGANNFTDVKDGAWYTRAIIWASANEIVSGYGESFFGPGDPITREQIAAILHRYASYKGYDVAAAANLTAYTDLAEISGWAQPAMGWANAARLITGRTATTLVPKGTAIRAEVASISMRFLEGFVK